MDLHSPAPATSPNANFGGACGEGAARFGCGVCVDVPSDSVCVMLIASRPGHWKRCATWQTGCARKRNVIIYIEIGDFNGEIRALLVCGELTVELEAAALNRQEAIVPYGRPVTSCATCVVLTLVNCRKPALVRSTSPLLGNPVAVGNRRLLGSAEPVLRPARADPEGVCS